MSPSLQPCPRNGASLGEEVVLTTSGRAGGITAGVGRVRRLDFLSILRRVSLARCLSTVQNPSSNPLLTQLDFYSSSAYPFLWSNSNTLDS
jgi:hypothetical protein